ncbi:hypothetical protein [Bifidobacterium aquikefiri]|uniref:hypothetical protein n=1 Tax=Bifidobacterium aquikefiri TaxID=1653207 RepID=UPI0023F4543C|nr:hypothetical protein [Bifidobacterium aquikefiri]
MNDVFTLATFPAQRSATATIATIDTSNLTVAGELGMHGLWLATLVGILLVCALIALIVWLWHPRKVKLLKRTGAHSQTSRTDPWHGRIDDIEQRYESGEITREEAFVALARVAREYASKNLSKDVRSNTLAEFGNESRMGSNRHGIDLLRQTIAALYPPEFADTTNNRQAKESTVHEAARWVGRLTERWRI